MGGVRPIFKCCTSWIVLLGHKVSIPRREGSTRFAYLEDVVAMIELTGVEGSTWGLKGLNRQK